MHTKTQMYSNVGIFRYIVNSMIPYDTILVLVFFILFFVFVFRLNP